MQKWDGTCCGLMSLMGRHWIAAPGLLKLAMEAQRAFQVVLHDRWRLTWPELYAYLSAPVTAALMSSCI